MLFLEKEEIAPGVEAGHRPEENKRSECTIKASARNIVSPVYLSVSSEVMYQKN
jgi:hypothetical protein